MNHQTPSHTSDAAQKLASLGAEKLAEIIVTMSVPAGTTIEWDSETIESVLMPLAPVFKELDIPWIGDTSSDLSDLQYWVNEAESHNLYVPERTSELLAEDEGEV